MEPGEALSTAAQIAVTLAGFAGVVVAFRSKSLHEWSPRERFRLWLLLGNALIPLIACLFGMLLLTIKPTPLSIWHLCSVFSLLLSFPFGLSSWRRLSKLGPTVIKNMGAYRYLFYMVGILGTAMVLSQFYNALVAGFFWLFYAAVVFPLAIGTLQFALMILLPPHTSET
jgi:hypothetical protein